MQRLPEWLLISKSGAVQGLCFVLFLWLQNNQIIEQPQIREIPPAIQKAQAQQLSFGSEILMARMLLVWLQTFDSQSGKIIGFDTYNYQNLLSWFEVIESLDPHSQYVFLTASRIFIESKNPEHTRQIIAFVHKQFLMSPAERWRWQLDVTLVAKHRLHDLSLARQLAHDLNQKTQALVLPNWVRDIEHLILAEMGEVEAAIIVIDGLLREGMIKDANEIRFLTMKLKELHKRRSQ